MSNTEFKAPTVKERTTSDLLELTVQLHTRAAMYNTKELHEAYAEGRNELDSRLTSLNEHYRSKTEGPFRVGKKSGRTVLDMRGVLLCKFEDGQEMLARMFCDFLNSPPFTKDPASTPSQPQGGPDCALTGTLDGVSGFLAKIKELAGSAEFLLSSLSPSPSVEGTENEYERGYAKAYKDASFEAAKEIQKNYNPNDYSPF